MKIVKRGNANEIVVYHLTCNVCETKVDAIEGDPMIGIHNNQYYRHVHWVCPVCKNHVDSVNNKGAFAFRTNRRFSTPEERAEMASWEDLDTYLDDLSEEDLAWIKSEYAED